MQKLDENGELVQAGEELFCTAAPREAAAFLRSGFPTLAAEETNMHTGRLPFLYTVLANHATLHAGGVPGYLQCRGELPQRAANAGLEAEGVLVLDEGAGHELYLAQPKAAPNGAFGRAPILVWFEYKTGTVLCENSDVLARLLQEFAPGAFHKTGGVV